MHLSQLTEKQSKKKEDEDDNFFDEFERKTGGENFDGRRSPRVAVRVARWERQS